MSRNASFLSTHGDMVLGLKRVLKYKKYVISVFFLRQFFSLEMPMMVETHLDPNTEQFQKHPNRLQR